MEAIMEKERGVLARRMKPVILSDKVLADFIASRSRKSLKDLKGKIIFRDDYDYKSMRS
jgi:hypothetical protein